METIFYKKAIQQIPVFFNTQADLEHNAKHLFLNVKEVLDFDEAYIFFLNSEGFELKYSFGEHLKISDEFFAGFEFKNRLFEENAFVLDDEDFFIKSLEFENMKSFLLSGISIRETCYGFILLCKSEKDFYMPKHLEVLKAFATIVSYQIKDVELSNVFKIQLKALKDGIVETNNAYKTIKEQNVKILEADKVKNDFIANISHELRTPLNAIIGFSEVLLQKIFGEMNDKQEEYIKDIHTSGIHLLGMINEILDISKIESNAMKLNLTEFDISRAVDEVVNVIKPLADKKKIELNVEMKEDFVVKADFQKIRQILFNLLSNAIKFSPKSDVIYIRIFKNKNNFILEIQDNGIGIDKKYHEKIFTKFAQLEDTYTKTESSTGLGLTITKELVDLHKGRILLKSEINKGATFTVEIPLK